MKTRTLFEAYQAIIKKYYGRTVSAKTFNQFVDYTKKGQEVAGVKPILNPINLYAFGLGISAEDASRLLFEKSKAIQAKEEVAGEDS